MANGSGDTAAAPRSLSLLAFLHRCAEANVLQLDTVPERHRRFGGADELSCLATSSDLDVVLDRLESELHFQTAIHARRRLFVHAGVVGWHPPRRASRVAFLASAALLCRCEDR